MRDLTAAQRAAYLDTLVASHRTRTRVTIYDHDEVEIGLFTAVVDEGQVDIDGTADITRGLSLSLSDPDLKFSFTPMGDIYADKYVAASYGVSVPDLGWVDVGVFRGPVARYQRNGHEIRIEAVGKESLMMPPVKQLSIPTPTDRKVTSYIRAVASSYGEALFDLGQAKGRTVPRSFDLDPSKAQEKGTWWYLRQLADAVNMQLLYDGRGYLCLRAYQPDTVIYTFADVTDAPAVGFDLSAARNRVEVFGRDSQDHDVMKARRDLVASHPLSAESLGRGGVPRILVEKITLDNVKLSKAAADDIANRRLRQLATQAVDVQFDAPPAPHLEVGDTCRLVAGGTDTLFGLRKCSIPLGPATMAVGYTRPQPVARYRSSRRRWLHR